VRALRHLNTFDYAVILAYLGVLVIMGFYLRRLASASLEDYFLGGKRLPWWLLGVSGMGNFIDMTGTMIIVSFLYLLGPRGLYVEFRGGAVLVLIFMLCWTGKWHRRSNCMTGAEWNVYRFGQGRDAQAARLMSAVATIVFVAGMLAYLITGAGLFLSMFLPFSPKVCALVMVGVTVVYTVVSGFYGVVYTDLVQCLIIVAAVIVITVLAVGQVRDYPGDLGALALEVTGNPQWTSSIPHVHTWMPPGYDEFQPLLWVACFYVLRNVLTGLGSGIDSRYFAARNERDCGLLTFFWTWLMTFRWPMMMGFAVMGLFLMRDMFPRPEVLKEAEIAIKTHVVRSARPGVPLDLTREPDLERIIRKAQWGRTLARLKAAPEECPELRAQLRAALGENWPAEFQRLCHQDQIVREVLPKERWDDVAARIIHRSGDYPDLVNRLRAILGDDWKNKLYMVSYEGTVNAERILPAVLLHRIPKGLRGLFVVALLAAAMSTFSPTVNLGTAMFTRDIYQAFLRPLAGNVELIWASYAFGVVLTAASFALAYTTRSINDIWDWIIMGLNSGLALPTILRLYWWRFNAVGIFVGTGVGLAAAVVQRMVWPDLGPTGKFTILTLISLVGTVGGTYLAPPTDRKILEHFYRTTRPFGFWGPLRDVLPPELREATRREHRNDLLALPFAFFWQVTLFLIPMQLVIGSYRAALVTGIIFSVSLAGVYFFWYRNLPPARAVAAPAPAEAATRTAGDVA